MNRADRLSRLLRWYPAKWRERYGDEFVTLLNDSLADQEPTLRFRASVASAGLRERAREAGVLGRGRSSREQVRAGSLIVLGAWALMVVAGLGLVKTAEHFAGAMPAASRHSAQVDYDVTAMAAIAGASLIVAGSLIVIPSLAEFFRGGGLARVKGHLIRALATTLVGVASSVALANRAHHLSAFARNGGDSLYTDAFVTVALVAVVTLILWTRIAISVARQLRLSGWVLKVESLLAEGVAGSMIVITCGALLWWREVGLHASWYLQGSSPGVAVSPVTSKLVLLSSMMVVSSLIAAFGVLRIVRAPRRETLELVDN